MAIGLLIKSDRWNNDNLVECKIKNYSSINLPLNEEQKRMFTWLTTNQYRDKTENDKYIEALRWKEIIESLRKNGIDLLVTDYDETGAQITESIKGKKTRNIIAEQMNISTGQVYKITAIEEKATDKVKDALKDGKININNAEKLSNLPPEEQDKIIDSSEGNIIINTEITAPKVSISKTTLTKKEVQEDLDLLRTISKSYEDSNIDSSKYITYKKHIKAIRSFLLP